MHNRRAILAGTMRLSLAKPSIHTPFHIDFDWWSKNDRDWRIYLFNILCPEHQALFAELDADIKVDWVDPVTAEVQRVDGLQHVIMTHCAKQGNFYTFQTTLVDAVFRVFLTNGNTPLTPVELSEQLGRPANTILKTLSGARVYKGIRPCLNQ
jgi:hypothetical protein